MEVDFKFCGGWMKVLVMVLENIIKHCICSAEAVWYMLCNWSLEVFTLDNWHEDWFSILIEIHHWCTIYWVRNWYKFGTTFYYTDNRASVLNRLRFSTFLVLLGFFAQSTINVCLSTNFIKPNYELTHILLFKMYGHMLVAHTNRIKVSRCFIHQDEF